MKIISPFKDYYDHAVYGTYSDAPIFRREYTTQENIKIPDSVKTFANAHVRLHYDLNIHVLNLCGILYPIYTVHGKFFSTTDQVQKYIDNYVPESEYADTRRSLNRIILNRRKQINPINNQANFQLEEPIYLYTNLYSYFKTNSSKIHTNISLLNLGFQAVLESHIVYQKIEMFLNNRTTHDILVDTRTQNEIRDSKGFDNFSFKNAPKK